MNFPERKSVRLRGYNYSQSGTYFITICTKSRAQVLSKIIGGDTYVVPQNKLTEIGLICDKYINNINDKYENVKVGNDDPAFRVGLTRRVGSPRPTHNISQIVGVLKRFVNNETGRNIFQSSYYDHIIRNEEDYMEKCKYIGNNPLTWNLKSGEITEAENNTCCFTGHRLIPADDRERIYYKTKENVLRLIEKGVNKFICGGAVGYDLMCGEIVLYIKEESPHIELEIAVPFKNQAERFSDINKKRYERLLKCADRVTLLSEDYYRGCLHARNRYMVDNSSYIIAYCTKQSGGAYYTVEYARKKGVSIFLL